LRRKGKESAGNAQSDEKTRAYLQRIWKTGVVKEKKQKKIFRKKKI
jgi:hypothetical protein